MCDEKVKKNTREDMVDFSCGGKNRQLTTDKYSCIGFMNYVA